MPVVGQIAREHDPKIVSGADQIKNVESCPFCREREEGGISQICKKRKTVRYDKEPPKDALIQLSIADREGLKKAEKKDCLKKADDDYKAAKTACAA